MNSAFLENVFLKLGFDCTATSWESEASSSQLAVTETNETGRRKVIIKKQS